MPEFINLPIFQFTTYFTVIFQHNYPDGNCIKKTSKVRYNSPHGLAMFSNFPIYIIVTIFQHIQTKIVLKKRQKNITIFLMASARTEKILNSNYFLHYIYLLTYLMKTVLSKSELTLAGYGVTAVRTERGE